MCYISRGRVLRGHWQGPRASARGPLPQGGLQETQTSLQGGSTGVSPGEGGAVWTEVRDRGQGQWDGVCGGSKKCSVVGAVGNSGCWLGGFVRVL